MRSTRILSWIAGLMLLAVALLYVAGLLTPRDHRARSCISLNQPAESLWAVMRDIEGTPAWWPELTRVTRVDSAGRERWREEMGDWTTTVTVEETAPGSEFHTIIEVAPDSVFGGRWIYRLTPSPVGQTACVTEEGWIGNPAFRIISRLMGQHGNLDSYLTALARRFGTEYRPEHLD
ncbi:MAG: SRPBCC family protein [Gemmatimonadetes bacterium]|nr:SRPBCC family protein [Gemmatimonadota bacterium]